jgi:hypothetical protein
MSRPLSIAETDRRRAPRLVVELEGRVFPNGDRCMIVNLSEDGACVRMFPPRPVGEDVVLVEWESGRAYDGQVVWAKGVEFGMRFIRSCQLQERAPVALAEVKAAWETRGQDA